MESENQTNGITLLPCPFCGGEAHAYKNNWWHVACERAHNCCVTMSAFATEAEAIAAWNTRACCEEGAVPMTEENMAKHGWVRERTCKREKHGTKMDGSPKMRCSLCGYGSGDKRWGYCPSCGAKVVSE